MITLSSWYTQLSDVTFPTSFIQLTDAEIEALTQDLNNQAKKTLWTRMSRVLGSYSGGLVIGVDCCAPTDSPAWQRRRILHTPISSWKQLTTSDKVKNALTEGHTRTLYYRPYRRMDAAREFRLFIKGGELKGASQYHVQLGYVAKLHKQADQLWQNMQNFYNDQVKPFYQTSDYVMDVYLCSDGNFLIIDLNDWGGETKPLMMRNWELSGLGFSESPLLLVKKAVPASGDISVSF